MGIFRIKRQVIILAAIALLFAAALCPPAAAEREVRVALTELKPSLFTNDRGEPDGFFVAIVEAVAHEEGWNVVWVSGSISRSWERLSAGEIDLMPAVSSTPERQALYDFSNESALSVWSQVYARPGSGISTILDLEGKRVAMVRGASSGSGFRDYAKRFDVNVTGVEKDTPAEIFAAVASGDADALVVYNTAGDADAKAYGLTATPVMFNPVQLGFAVQKGKNQDLLAALDRGIAEEKTSPASPYNVAMQRWYGIEAGSVIPPWVFWGIAGVAGMAILFLGMSFVLRREVGRKTAELSRQNEELRAAYEQLAAAEENLRKNYGDLTRSEQSLMQARKKLNLLNTLTFREIRNGIFSLAGFIQLARQAGPGSAAEDRLVKGEEILRSVESSLDFANKYQNLGIGQPRWQDVNLVLVTALSHLDYSGISRVVKLDQLEIFADPLFEDVFFTIMENILVHGKGATEVRIGYRRETDGISILVEDNGPGVPAAEKERIFSWEHRRRGSTGLFLAREILSITDISLGETGTPGAGARFEIRVPDGRYRFPVTG